MKKEEAVLDTILTISYDMLRAGLEIGTVERAIERMCIAYQMEEVHVLTITSSILVSARAQDGAIYTQTRRIRDYHTDFTYLKELDGLVRRMIDERMDYKIAAAELKKLREQFVRQVTVRTALREYFVYCFISFTFSLFFGGSIWDGISSCICAVLICSILYLLKPAVKNKFLVNMAASVAGGAAAVILFRCGLSDSVDKVIIGNIMLLIPGLATVNAFRDLIGGDTISGLLRLAEALVAAAAIAIGFSMAFII
jgi:uncharacterized membrane protein YjjP (DUF1212 family)